MDVLQILMTPFSWLMKTLYFLLFENYGLALIVFALLVKVILFPLSLKGKKSMIQTTMLQGKTNQLQKQFGKDKNRYNEEVQKLYAKEGVNPMGGCMWSMIPMFILFPLYAVVRRPLRYLCTLTDPVIASITTTVTPLLATLGIVPNVGYPEISIISAFHGAPDVMSAAQGVVTAAGSTSTLFGMNFNFLGIDLAAVPQLKFWEGGLSWPAIGLFLIPLVSAVFSFISSKIMMQTNSMNGGAAPEGAAASTNKMMMLMSPIMSLWIGFAMPAGMGIYWIANSVFGVAQELVASKLLKKDYAKAAAARAKQDILDKEEEKKHKLEVAEERARRIEEGKQNKTKAKPAGKKALSEGGGGNESGKVGIRNYARGRAYDPNRFGAVTAYKDPSAPVDETAVTDALEAKETRRATRALAEDTTPEIAELVETTAELVETTDVVDAEVVETTAELVETTDSTLTDAPEYDAPDYHEDKKTKE